MIEIQEAVYPSVDQWDAVIKGMRNPMNSWDKNNSFKCFGTNRLKYFGIDGVEIEAVEEECKECPNSMWYLGDTVEEMLNCDKSDREFEGCLGFDITNKGFYRLGKNDLKLARNLINSGPEHMKFLRQLPVILDINAPLYWWKQMDQYKIGTTTDSCSTMHKLVYKEFELDDFSFDYADNLFEDIECPNEISYYNVSPKTVIEQIISALNVIRNKYLETKDKKYWNVINEVLPQSYNQLRTWSTNYAVLFTICAQRAGHKLSEWNDFIEDILDIVPHFKELCFDKLCEVSRGFNEQFNA